ncbi:hypothetical protein KFK09_009307 [Dendrobium nobile]|uniref:Uncharacterized protein n=1 Tax=Dendrobium nobile TaxID=94219 RepID=A0A8T3BSB0_DENNO|nr:hypothetical protein KFK09_009307 [Dendrobium nobile]
MAEYTAPSAGYARSDEIIIPLDSGHSVLNEPVIPSTRIMVSGNNVETEDVQRKRWEKVAKLSSGTCFNLSGTTIIAGVAKPNSISHGELILFKASVVMAILTFFAGLALLISVLYENVKRTVLIGLIIVAVFCVLAGVAVLAISVFI